MNHLKSIKAAFGLTILILGAVASYAQAAALPPLEAGAKDRLNTSPRHGEWVSYDADGGKVDAWVVYPERKDPAPVVIVIHEIYGLTDWVRAVADQFASEGFIAIAPDFLSGKAPGGKGSSAVDRDGAVALVRTLDPKEIVSRLNGAAAYATSLPAASKKYGVVGYCWGGGISFGYATMQPGLSAAVVFYGTAPATETLAGIKAPVLGHFGGADNRVNATIPAAETELKRLDKRFEYEIYEGAGHGFLRQQDGQNGANLRATQKAWPRTIEFLKQTLSERSSSAPAPEARLAAAFANAVCPDDDCALPAVNAAAIAAP